MDFTVTNMYTDDEFSSQRLRVKNYLVVLVKGKHVKVQERIRLITIDELLSGSQKFRTDLKFNDGSNEPS